MTLLPHKFSAVIFAIIDIGKPFNAKKIRVVNTIAPDLLFIMTVSSILFSSISYLDILMLKITNRKVILTMMAVLKVVLAQETAQN